MPCSICRSYEHLVDECPTIPAEREMFGDCNTYNSNWRDHPNFSWKPQPPQYKQHVQALPQASILEQAMVNLSKFVGDFVGKQEATNAQINQRIDSVESSLIKRMDEVQNDLSQKLDILQDSISRLANLNTVQEKENSPSQPYQNSMTIHEMEAKEGESSQKREVKEVITLRSSKEVDLPTCKLEHKVESETEKEKREKIKGKKKGKSIEKDDYDFDIDEEPQRIVIKEEMMKHMPPSFLQALYGKILQSKSKARDANFIWDPGKLNHRIKFFDGLSFWMIKIKRNCKEIEGSLSEQNRSENRAKTGQKQGKNREKTGVCEISQPLRNRHFAVKPFRNTFDSSAKIFAAANPRMAHECHFATQKPPFRSCEPPKHEILHFVGKAPFRRESIALNGAQFGFETEKLWPFEDDCANHEQKCRTSILLLLDTFLKHFLELKLYIPYLVSNLGK
ncbi:hypothetical protein CK203_055755 [Vitis vinifera]|uniref:Uncharacterized protein n=1 Tax=Vitis vinifera TaxID=29760 RepID=A0A438H1C8_VITVI|nr:hypothetical protein CK203_055755 [Vitis vinifera]